LIVQIYTMQTPAEALAVVESGADHVGVTPSHMGLPGEVDFAMAHDIVAAVHGPAVCLALTVETDPEAILTMAAAVQPDVLHLCGPTRQLRPPAVAALRQRIPAVRILQAISVDGPQAAAEARAFEPVCDFLLLDTQAPDIPGIGASGKTHDWSISRAIVEAVQKPVILAGGLSPENVAAAILAVHPWGVDSLTHTNRALPGGGFRKDIERVRAFAAAARAGST
jgi:phosphoribosylanthranilate isomerase